MGLEWEALWEAMKEQWNNRRKLWVKTTAAMFYNQLGVVPPVAMNENQFLVGEAWSHNANGEKVFACFMHEPASDTYMARYMTIREFAGLN